MKFSTRHFIIFCLIFGLEVLIALYLKESIIRPFVGDFLVVALIYYFFKSFLKTPPAQLVLAVFLFALIVEFSQLFEMAKMLQLEDNRLARIVLGSTFDPIDILMYFLGCWAILLSEFRRITKS